MEQLGKFAVRHPLVIGAFFAVLAGFGTLNAYRAGVAVGEARVLAGDAARLASEALGG